MWLEEMNGRAPSVIINDKEKSTRAAILEVLPSTTHRLCMWHILQKKFEHEWAKLIQKYELQENNWLTKLYGQREQWIPAYLRGAFCAGMSTTQRSESMNKIFKGFGRSSTLVSDFVHQYEKLLNSRYIKEKEKDLKTNNTKPRLKTCYKIEAEAAEIYTRKLFLMFQEEFYSSKKYMSSKHRQDGSKKYYFVMSIEEEKPV
ncbi:hypothetical protein MIMGU_mgv1a023244mg [Erythranthe guttata]|uniref:Protein FAR1-RELATED SEQUENCE n=1 Tax=Erythranthe guttata TaxID=4155 RepID=A0A022S2F9_ERYGU|nr:hypothetical protein MIMGU_mgv1a023244mg [Erythranthe guttata]